MRKPTKTNLAARLDRMLVQQVREGNPAALNEIFQLYSGKVRSLCAALAGDETVADDLAQEIYLRAFQFISSLPDKTTFEQLLFTITGLVVAEYLRVKEGSQHSAWKTNQSPRLKGTQEDKSQGDIKTSFSSKTECCLSAKEHKLLKEHLEIKKLPLNYTVKSWNQLIQSVQKEKVLRSRLAPDNRFLQRYHYLIDKRLSDALSRKEAQELHRVEETIESFENAETFEAERGVEERHRTMMQQLSELTAELRRFS